MTRLPGAATAAPTDAGGPNPMAPPVSARWVNRGHPAETSQYDPPLVRDSSTSIVPSGCVAATAAHRDAGVSGPEGRGRRRGKSDRRRFGRDAAKKQSRHLVAKHRERLGHARAGVDVPHASIVLANQMARPAAVVAELRSREGKGKRKVESRIVVEYDADAALARRRVARVPWRSVFSRLR